MTLQQELEALRRPLQLAAADRFAGLDKIGGLGNALRTGVDRVIALGYADVTAKLAPWRQALGGWDQLTRDEQAVAVARGLRLVQSLAGAAKAQPKILIGRQGAEEAKVSAKPDPLSAPATTLKGIGPSLAAALAERSITTIEDLLWLLPRRYDDARSLQPLGEALEGVEAGVRVAARVRVAGVRMIRARGRRWAEMRCADPDGGPPRLTVRWFNVWGGFEQRFPIGAEVALSGVVKVRGGTVEMANPDILSGGAAILPRHPDIAGVPAARLKAACLAAVATAGAHLDDGVPEAVLARRELGSLADAIATLHAPPGELAIDDVVALNAGTSRWQRRLAWGELFVLGVAVAGRRRARRNDTSIPCPKEFRRWSRGSRRRCPSR